MFSCIKSGGIRGLDSFVIDVETDVSHGLPCFQMVGYLGNEVREARDRVKVALKNSGFVIPPMSININLSPANIHKDGPSYDLPIAIGILCSLGDISLSVVSDTLIIGELGLDGEIRRVNGILPIVQKAKESGISRVILPYDNLSEGALVPGIEILGAHRLIDVYNFFTQGDMLCTIATSELSSDKLAPPAPLELFENIHGQTAAKRAALVAASGFHNMLMIGPPGSGKTMIARCLPGILPPLSVDEALEVTSIYSVSGMTGNLSSLITNRPFMSPHHSITISSLSGGGRIPRPGVISLAHRGVLFLDEMTEYNRATLDIMRQPLEEKCIHISRLHGTYKYPADFMLVAACNPCPCGYYPDMNRCNCTKPQVDKYLGRISGPLLDRIDICCDIEPVDLSQKYIPTDPGIYTTSNMSNIVLAARERQQSRFGSTSAHFNADMSGRDIDKYCRLTSSVQTLLADYNAKLGLSARSYHRVLKLARTIADIEDQDSIREEHIAEAIFYRTSGSRYWGH